MYIVGISCIIHNIHVQMYLFMEKKYIDFFRTNNIPFMEKKKGKNIFDLSPNNPISYSWNTNSTISQAL